MKFRTSANKSRSSHTRKCRSSATSIAAVKQNIGYRGAILSELHARKLFGVIRKCIKRMIYDAVSQGFPARTPVHDSSSAMTPGSRSAQPARASNGLLILIEQPLERGTHVIGQIQGLRAPCRGQAGEVGIKGLPRDRGGVRDEQVRHWYYGFSPGNRHARDCLPGILVRFGQGQSIFTS